MCNSEFQERRFWVFFSHAYEHLQHLNVSRPQKLLSAHENHPKTYISLIQKARDQVLWAKRSQSSSYCNTFHVLICKRPSTTYVRMTGAFIWRQSRPQRWLCGIEPSHHGLTPAMASQANPGGTLPFSEPHGSMQRALSTQVLATSVFCSHVSTCPSSPHSSAGTPSQVTVSKP